MHQWICANKEPSMRTIETANARFHVDRCARGQTGLPILDKFLPVVWMNRFRPPPAPRLYRSHARVIEPHLIDEVEVAVRTTGPCRHGDCIDDCGKIVLARPQSLFRTGVGDSDGGLIRE